MSPLASSSSERVVSFLSRDAEPPRELVQGARVLRRHEDAEVLVGGVLGDLDRCEDSHDSSDQGVDVLDLLLEPLDEQPDLLPQILDPLAAHRPPRR